MNVIWIISDTLRRDHLGCYGNKTIHTPSLDALGAKSVRFDRHYIASFATMPARADFLTGRWTGSFMSWEPFHFDAVVLPEILKEKGFNTAAVVDTPFYIRDEMNYDHGFLDFFEIPGQWDAAKVLFTPIHDWRPAFYTDIRAARRLESDYFAPRTFTKAMQWLECHYKEDFFLWVDTWDPHEPWDPPRFYTELYWPDYDGEDVLPLGYDTRKNSLGLTDDEERIKKAHACYCGEVTMVDTWLGYFLRRLENMGLMEKTAIIFTNDHGYYFGEHGGLFGKMSSYEEVTAAPLLIYAPNIPPGAYSGLTSAIDLAPTVLDVLGQEIPSTMEGQSLLPAMKNSSVAGREYVVSGPPFFNKGKSGASVGRRSMVSRAHLLRWSLLRREKYSPTTVTTHEWSLIYAVEPGMSELYHLSSDPKQEKNVINEHPEVAQELHQQLVKFMRETNVPELLLKPRLELR